MNEERKKKDYLNTQYINSIEYLIDLLKYKSDLMENEYDDINQITNQCQLYFEQLNNTSREVKSTVAITQFSEQLKILKSSISLSKDKQ